MGDFLRNAQDDFLKAVHKGSHDKCQRIIEQLNQRNLRTQFFSYLLNDKVLPFKAAQSGNPAIIQLLAENGVSFNLVDAHGTTPLIMAATSGSAYAVNFLLSVKQIASTINAARVDGSTALHRAAEHGHFDVVKALVMNQADYMLKNTKGQTAYDRAKKKNKKDIARYLATLPGLDELSRRNSESGSIRSEATSATPSVAQSTFTFHRHDEPHQLDEIAASHSSSKSASSNVDSALPRSVSMSTSQGLAPSGPDTATINQGLIQTRQELELERRHHELTRKELKLIEERCKGLERELDQANRAYVTEREQHNKTIELQGSLNIPDNPAIKSLGIDIDKFEYAPEEFQKLSKLRLPSRARSANVYTGIWRGTEIIIKNLGVTKGQVKALLNKCTPQYTPFEVRELLLSFELRHPQLVTCLGITFKADQSDDDDEDHELCLVLERAPADSLFDLVHVEGHAESALKVDFVDTAVKLQLLQDVFQGLHFLHLSGIVHRDFKSPNCLVWSEGRAKVADFGTAVARVGERSVTMRQGTLAWSSPEQLEAHQRRQGKQIKLSEATDVYSAGLVMVEVLTGVLPSSVDMVEQCSQISDARLRATAQIMLSRDPNARPNLKSVIEVLKNIQTMGDRFTMDHTMDILTGPENAPWKPPSDLLGSFDRDQVCRHLPMENSLQAMTSLGLDNVGLHSECIGVELLWRPAHEVGFYNRMQILGARLLGRSTSPKHPFRPNYQPSAETEMVLQYFQRTPQNLVHKIIPEDVFVQRMFMAFPDAVSASDAINQGLITTVECGQYKGPGAMLTPSISYAISLSLSKAGGSTAIVVVCDVVYGSPFPYTATSIPRSSEELCELRHDCVVRMTHAANLVAASTVNSTNVGEIFVDDSSMLLPRALLHIETGSMV